MNRAKGHLIDVASLARAHGERAIQQLSAIMEKGTEEGNRVRAAIALLERGWGKPPQDNTVKGELKVVIRKMMDGE